MVGSNRGVFQRIAKGNIICYNFLCTMEVTAWRIKAVLLFLSVGTTR